MASPSRPRPGLARALAVAGLLLGSDLAVATSSFALSGYSTAGIFDLDPVLASEASAIAYRGDTGTLFVLGDEGDHLLEVDRVGNTLSSMTLSGFDDTEGLTWIGGDRFLLAEERIQDLFELQYVAGGLAQRSNLVSWDLGPTVGNIGLEGVFQDPGSGRLLGVTEKTPQSVYDITLGVPPAASVTSLPAPAGLLDLSDVAALSAINGIDPGQADNLLILSQESRRLVEVDAAGSIVSELDLSFFSTTTEGLTVAPDGTLFLVAETVPIFDPSIGGFRALPAMLVLEPHPVPLPGAAWLIGPPLALMVRPRRRRTERR